VRRRGLRSGHSPRTALAARVAYIVGRRSILASPFIATITRPDAGGQETMLLRNRDLGPRKSGAGVTNSPPGVHRNNAGQLSRLWPEEAVPTKTDKSLRGDLPSPALSGSGPGGRHSASQPSRREPGFPGQFVRSNSLSHLAGNYSICPAGTSLARGKGPGQAGRTSADRKPAQRPCPHACGSSLRLQPLIADRPSQPLVRRPECFQVDRRAVIVIYIGVYSVGYRLCVGFREFDRGSSVSPLSERWWHDSESITAYARGS